MPAWPRATRALRVRGASEGYKVDPSDTPW